MIEPSCDIRPDEHGHESAPAEKTKPGDSEQLNLWDDAEQTRWAMPDYKPAHREGSWNRRFE